MQKLLGTLLAATVLISCKNNPGGGHGHTPPCGSPMFDSTLIPLATADTLIYNYRKYNDEVLGLPEAHAAFVLNADALREYLNSNTDIKTLNVYMGKTDAGAMTDTSLTIVYIGGIDSAGYDIERPYYKPGDTTPYMMDHAMPCPVCLDRVEIYTPPVPPQPHQ